VQSGYGGLAKLLNELAGQRDELDFGGEPVVRAGPARDADQTLARGMTTAGIPQDMALYSELALGAGRLASTSLAPAAHPPVPVARRAATALQLRIGVLGSLTVNGHAAALVPAQSQLILTLALTRGGLGNTELRRLLGADASHPKPADSLRQLIARTRRALGQAPDGREWIEHLGHGRYALHPDAWLDWREFGTLTAAGIQRGEVPPLADALGLVRGQPFAGCYYWWLEPELVDTVTTSVVAAAEALGTLKLTEGDPAGAVRAARIGLAADSSAEQLWRVLMRAEHAAGNLAGVHGAWGRCLEVASEVAVDGQPDAATAAVYRQLLAR